MPSKILRSDITDCSLFVRSQSKVERRKSEGIAKDERTFDGVTSRNGTNEKVFENVSCVKQKGRGCDFF